MQPEGDPIEASESNSTTLKIRQDSLSRRKAEALETTNRKKLVLGRHVKQTIHGVQIGGIAWYEPSPFSSEFENTFVYGPSGSGKTYEAYALASQSFFYENRTWLIFDTKLSVPKDTLVYARVNGIEQVMPIGDLVDPFIPGNHHGVAPAFNVEVPSVCRDHSVKWMAVTSVSKHVSPQNILQVTTKSGKQVVATEGHSFLTLDHGEYKEMKGSDLRIGDLIPMCKELPTGTMDDIDVTTYFDKGEIVDFDTIQNGIEMAQSIPIATAYTNGNVVSSNITLGAFYRYAGGEREIKRGTFKLITANNSKTSHFPKVIKLDRSFGFLCGIFIAEGHAKNKKGSRQIAITNQTEANRQAVIQWLEATNVNYLINDKGISISSLPLTMLFTRWFGDGIKTNSATKKLPPFIFNANRDFLTGFLDGYMSGDGSVRPMPRVGMSFSTKSERLCNDLTILFLKFGMSTRVHREKSMYTGEFSGADILKFKQIGFTYPKKQQRLDEYTYDENECVDWKYVADTDWIFSGLSYRNEPSTTKNILKKIGRKDAFTTYAIRKACEEMKARHPDRASKLKGMLDGGAWWDRIVSIDRLSPTSDFVYDISVDDVENFMLANGSFVHNSYLGNWRPNLAFAEDLAEFGMQPRGIPGSQIDIIAPEYYMQYISTDEIRRTCVTQKYRIPLALCRLGIMFELTKLKKGAGYAAQFEVLFQNLLKETNNNPTIDQFKKMTEDMMQDDKFPGNMVWVFNMMLDRIDRIAKFTIDDKHQWSPVGDALFKAARENKPRWIVFTLAHSQSPTDAANLAMLTAVLEEVKAFAKKMKVANTYVPLGVFIDELHTFVNDPQSTSVHAVHDLMHAWGRSSKVWRMYATQKQEQLPKTFRDSVDNITSAGTYQNIISCQQVPEPGYGRFLDRLHGRGNDDSPVSNMPRLYPAVKYCPPMIEVESDYADDKDWKRAIMEKFSGTKKKRVLPVSNEPWEDIAANLSQTNAKLRDAVQSNPPPRVAGTILRGSPATLPEVRGMWGDVGNRLGAGSARDRQRR
jgi:intein/homing endonuclease